MNNTYNHVVYEARMLRAGLYNGYGVWNKVSHLSANYCGSVAVHQLQFLLMPTCVNRVAGCASQERSGVDTGLRPRHHGAQVQRYTYTSLHTRLSPTHSSTHISHIDPHIPHICSGTRQPRRALFLTVTLH